MELKSSIELEVKKNDRCYKLYIPNGAPSWEACDAAHEMLETLIQLAKENFEKSVDKKNSIKKEVLESTEETDESGSA